MRYLWTWYSRQGPLGRRLLGFVLALVGVAAAFGVLWFTPTPYFITAPGAAIDTSRLLRVEDGEAHPGRLFMLVVTSQRANLLWYLYAQADPRAELETREEFLGPVEDYEKYVKLTRRMMADSQQTAKAVALQQLGYGRGVYSGGAEVVELIADSAAEGYIRPGDVIIEVDGRPVSSAGDLSEIIATYPAGSRIPVRLRRDGEVVSLTVPTGEHPDRKGTAAFGVLVTDHLTFDVPIPIEIEAGAITGPSAGLMFTLQIIDQLTPGGLAPDLVVAGTGTIEPDGSVGPIGGVRQKVYTAEAAGAQVIFVPQENYEDAQAAASRIQVVPVGHLRDALSWLRAHGNRTGKAG